MKIRKLTKIALAFVLSNTLLFEGCKKYDDDLSRLEGQISSLKTDLDQLAKGSTIEKVNVIPDGLELILVDYQGNKNTHKVTNGKDGVDGQPGTIWQINSTSKEWEYSKDGGWASTGIIAQGKDGKDGLPGQDGQDGLPGQDGQDGLPGQDGKDGKDGLPGQNGQDGLPGTNGTTPEIKEDLSSGKFYWWIGTTNTGIIAYPGEVYAIDGTEGVTVTIWSADGSSPIDVYFSKTKNSITSITLIPDMVTAEAGTAVINFPRIIIGADKNNTLMSGVTFVSYKLNPFGVNPNKYDIEGFVSQYNREAPKLRSGSGDALENFNVSVDQQATTFGELRLKVTAPTDANNPFAKLAASGKDRMNIALRVNNTWAGQQAGDPNMYKVTSSYNVAMEELINNSELTIEKIDEASVAPEYKLFPTDIENNYYNTYFPTNDYHYFIDNDVAFLLSTNSQNTLVNFDNSADFASTEKAYLRDKAILFTLSYKEDAATNVGGIAPYRGGIDLSEKLKGFFVRQFSTGERLVSMDENGFMGYKLKFSIPGAYNPANASATAIDPTDHNSYITLDPDGKVKVNLTGGGGYNINAVGKTPIVKVDMVTDDGAATVMATRYIKLGISQTIAPTAVGTVLATATAPAHLLVGGAAAMAAVPLTYVVNSGLDDLLGTLNMTSSQFYSTYQIHPSTPQVITGGPAGAPTGNLQLITNAASKETRLRINGVNVRPGTYTIKTKYTPITPNPAEPPIDLTVTVTLDESRIATLTPTATNWSNGKGKINGFETAPGLWEMTSTLIDLWQIKPVAVPGTPITKYKFEIVNSVSGITLSNPGAIELSTGPITQAITLDHTDPVAKTYINDPSKTVKIKLTTYVTVGNIEHSVEEFDVFFINPVAPILAKEPTLTMRDKDPNALTPGVPMIDLRRVFEVKDVFGAAIFDYKVTSAFAFDPTASKYNNTLASLYGIANLSQGPLAGTEGILATSPTGVEFVRAEYLDGTPMTMSASQIADIDPGTSNARWNNTGIGLTSPINLIYRIKLTNKFNDGTVPVTEDEVIKEIKIQVNPN